MTWSPFFRLVTPGPTSTTTPAPSWPRMAGNSPSGSAPDRVKSSVWQMPVALISIRTSPALGPSRSTSTISSGLPASKATAARVFMMRFSLDQLTQGLARPAPWRQPASVQFAPMETTTLTVAATITVLKKKENALWISTSRRMRFAVIATSATCAVMPMT